MTCACEFLKVYLFRMMTISGIQSKTGNLQVQLGLLCNFDHVVVNYVDVNTHLAAHGHFCFKISMYTLHWRNVKLSA